MGEAISGPVRRQQARSLRDYTALYAVLCLWIRRDSVGLIEMAAEVVLLRYRKQSIFFRASPQGASERPNDADRGAQRYLAAVAPDESF